MIVRHRFSWIFLGIALAAAVPVHCARAHDWYPMECCGGYDCGPASMQTVAAATYLAGIGGEPNSPFVSTVTATLADGTTQTVIVPADFPRRESPDGRMHACIVGGKLRCLFMPPAM